MHTPPFRRGAAAQSAEAFHFEAPLENEEGALDAMLAAMGRGTLSAESWDRLCAASQRDGRTNELAFAFEAVSHGKRMKTLAPALAAEVLHRAGCFFADAFGDEAGAVAYFERAIAVWPGHAGALERLERHLLDARQPDRLAEVCAAAATHRPRAEQPAFLRRAAELVSDAGGSDERVIELLQLLLKAQPGEPSARAWLEDIFARTGRLRDVVRLNEQALAADPPPDDDARRLLLARVVEVYADGLQEPERALPYVEQLLALDPESDAGRRVAERLVGVKGLAGRASAALANACEVSGAPEDVARYLAIELENTRGPRRATLLGRLGRLRRERLDDAFGAFEAFDQALAIDAADDGLRAEYLSLALDIGRTTEAAKTLGRVLATAKTPELKARAGVQLGEALRAAGDPKRAKAALAAVFSVAEAPADALLRAASELAGIFEEEGDARALCEALDRVSGLETDAARRQAVDERLAQVATATEDVDRATAAYERLLSTEARPRALAALAPLYELRSEPGKLAAVLEEQARSATDPTVAREQLLRAAEIRATTAHDAAAAILDCQAIVDRFGPARDVHARLLPLLESQRRWQELARALAAEVLLAGDAERAAVLVRLGIVRMQRLGDTRGAIDAFGQALDADAGERTARMTLERLTVIGDHRLAAARVLEPVYRRNGTAGPLLKVLELRGTLAEGVDERLDALREAADLAARTDPDRAVDIIGRALANAMDGGRPAGDWLARLDALGGVDSKRRAAALRDALGDRDVINESLSAVAKTAAEAYATCGDAPAALALFRRALAFEPGSVPLVARIDQLLRDHGSPRERVALYRAALAGADAPRRRELWHRLGAVERHELHDLGAATETYRAALDADADDVDAETNLRELYAEAGRWEDACALLETRLARVEGPAARTLLAELVDLAAEHGDPRRARLHGERLLEDPALDLAQLAAVARAAAELADVDLERAVLRRRAAFAADPREEIAALDALGDLEEVRRRDSASAAVAWRRAASVAESAGDARTARRLYARVLGVAPDDRVVTARMAELCEQARAWSELPVLYARLAEQAPHAEERVELLMRLARVLAEHLGDAEGAARSAARAFEEAPGRTDVLATYERLSVAAGMADAFEQAVDAALARSRSEPAQAGAPDEGSLLVARARVLASDPRRAQDAVAAYRGAIDRPGADPSRVAEALSGLEALLDSEAGSQLVEVRRWTLAWRCDHAPPEQLGPCLLRWARAEESGLGDPARALALYRKVSELDATCDEALDAVARLSLATGDTDGALSALRARCERAPRADRIAIELQIAQALWSHTARHEEVLAALSAVLAEAPDEPAARELAARLLHHDETRAAAIRMLERAADASGDAAARAAIFECLLDGVPAALPELEGARRSWHERLVALARERVDLDGAMAAALRAAREAPEVDTFWDSIEAMAREVGRPEPAADLYDEVLARMVAAEDVLRFGQRAVQFYAEWFDDPARMERALRRVLDVDATADWAFEQLKLVLDAAERWDDLFAVYDRALEASGGDEDQRARLLDEAAQTAKDFADRPDRAIAYLEALDELRPGDAKRSAALERLYERTRRHRDLIALLERRLPNLRADDARRARARMSSLWLDELGAPDAALDALAPALDANGGKALDASELLERILSTAPASSSPDGVRQRAARWLRMHYAASERQADVARMMRVELEAAPDAAARARGHVEIADVWERIGDRERALEELGRAVILDPADPTKRARLSALAQDAGSPGRVADFLVAAAAEARDPAVRAALALEAAPRVVQRAEGLADAIALLASALATPSLASDDELAVGYALEPLLDRAGRRSQRLDVCERLARIEGDVGRRRELLGRAAGLATGLGDAARAITLWDERLALGTEDDADALDALADLLGTAGRPERLVKVLERRARLRTDVALRRADRVRAAELLAGALGRFEEAISSWRAIEADFGEADDASAALASLLLETQRYEELARLLGRRAERLTDAVDRAAALSALADVQRERLNDAAAALDTYAAAIQLDPRDERSRAGLLAITAQEGLRAAAVGALLEGLRACDDWRAILEITPLRLAAADTVAAKLEVLFEAARLAETRGDDVTAAFQAARRALLVAPDHEAAETEASRLAEATGAWADLVAAYDEAIGDAEDVLLENRLRLRAALVRERRLGDAKGALAAYLRVAQTADPAAAAAARAAIRVASSLGEWETAARVLVESAGAHDSASTGLVDAFEAAASENSAWDKACAALSGAAARASLQGRARRDVEARIALWHRDQRGDTDAAQSSLERALEHGGDDVELLAALVDLQRPRADRSFVDHVVRLSNARAGDPPLLREAAQIARDVLGDDQLACAHATDLLELTRTRWSAGDGGAAADAGWAIETLAELHARTGNARAMIDVLAEVDALPFDIGFRQAARRRAARAAIDLLADADRAIALYLAMFSDDPRDPEPVDRLAALYEAQGRLRELLSLRERQLGVASDVGERLALRLEIARWHDAAGDPTAAADALRANLAENPGHELTVDRLARALESSGNHGLLHELLVAQARRAESASSSHRAADLWSKAAAVAELAMGALDEAETDHAHAAALEDRSESFDALARLAAARGDHRASARWLERLATVADGEGRPAVAARLADALTAAGDEERAAACLARALEESPGAEPLRNRLSAILRAGGDWSRLAAVVAEGADHAMDDRARLARLLEAAQLLSDRCGQPERAIPLLERASELSGGEPSVRIALADALARAGHNGDAATILRSLVGAFGARRPKERAPVHHQLARVALAAGDRPQALAELETAARIDPQNGDVLRSLAELARSNGQLDRAEKSYRALLAVLRRRPDAGLPPAAARSEVLLELSAIAREQGHAERARELVESAFEAGAEDEYEQRRLEEVLQARGDRPALLRALEARLARAPSDRSAWEPLAAMYVESGETSKLDDLVAAVAGGIEDPRARAALEFARLRATAAAGGLSDDEAAPWLRRVLDEDPGQAEAALMLCDVLERQGALEELRELLARQVDASKDRGDARSIVSLSRRLGALAERTDPRHARDLYYTALEWDPENEFLLDAIARLLDADADAAERADVLERKGAIESARRAGGDDGGRQQRAAPASVWPRG